MSIVNNYSTLTKIVSHISNPNIQTGTLIQEVPTDIGRSWAGYKRGGVIEGAEKLRKELMGAVVWIFGIPVFNKLGNLFCENILKIPMNIDYSNPQEGRDSIANSINYLTKGLNPDNLDVGDLKKYGTKFRKENISKEDLDALIKKTRGAKQVTSIAAIVLNCLAMGVIIPKINQTLTAKKLNETKNSDTYNNKLFISMDDYKKDTAKKDGLSFTGGLADYITYKVENSNRFRLLITDGPMEAGRVVTSRNKYEALEYLMMDLGSMYFYNFCKDNVQSFIRSKITKMPSINPKAAELLQNLKPNEIEAALNIQNPKDLVQILGKDLEGLAQNIYKEATHGKYGKINKFVKDSDLRQIDSDVLSLFRKIKEAAKDGIIDEQTIKDVIGKVNKANALALGAGLLSSIIGLAILVPKLTFAVTKKITGKDEFTGIANYDDDKKDVNKS